MLINKEMKMADIVHMNYLLVSVINRFGIQLGFGDKSINEICEENNVDTGFFVEIANVFTSDEYYPNENLIPYPTNLIVEYLNKSHAYYLEEEVPYIENLINQLRWENSKQEKNLLVLKNFFHEYTQELKIHVEHEENIVYPYALAIENACEEKKISAKKYQQIKNYSIKVYADEHDNIEEKLLDLKNIIIKYLPPPVNKKIYPAILYEVFKLERDLNDHSRIEEKVLVPKIKTMEQKLKKYMKKWPIINK